MKSLERTKFIKRISIVFLVLISLIVWFSNVSIYAESITDCSENMSINDCLKLQEQQESNNNLLEETGSMTEGSLLISFVKMIFALLLILGLIYIIFKMVGRKKLSLQQSKVIENLGGIPLGNNKSIQLVKIGNEVIVLGVGEDIRMLYKITDESTLSFIEQNQELTEAQTNIFEAIADTFQREKKSNEEKDSFHQLFTKELDRMKNHRKKIIKEHQKRDDPDE